MVIRFRIPNGEMTIHAEPFFQEARTGRIRKMLRLWRESGSSGEEYEGLLRWLGEKAAGVRGEIESLREEYSVALREVCEKDAGYRRMQDPDGAFYTRDRNRLKAARRELSGLKAETRRKKRELGMREKLDTRYREVLEDVKKILGMCCEENTVRTL